MIILQCKNLEKNYGEKNIFKNINFSLKENSKVALIGRNGVGKTTLLKCIISPSIIDKGEMIYSKNLTIGYLEQIFENEDLTLEEYLLSNFQNILEMRKKITNLEHQISLSSDNLNTEILLNNYSNLICEYENINGHQLESHIYGIINGLGFEKLALKRSLASFSGGEKSKISLASLLIQKPKLLILDEPTNHLDIASMEWLESFLKNYEGSILLISHDRRFIDNLVDEVYEMESNVITIYKGNFTEYEIAKEKRAKEFLKNFDKQQKIIEKTESFIQKYKAGNKSKQARGRQKQLDKLLRLEKKTTPKKMNLAPNRSLDISANQVLSIRNLSKDYNGCSILDNISFDIFRKEKIGLIGNNGSGKSTLLKLILEENSHSTGEIIIGNRVQIGYFDQNHKNLNADNTIYQEILTHFDLTKEEIRKALARFLFFEDDIDKKISILSGGEKARLSLMIILLKNPNFLILDEPTNHLDLESQQIIERYLSDYEGTILMVTHDRYLLDIVVDKIFLLKNHNLEIYYGNYSYCKEKQNENTLLKESPNLKKETIKPIVNKKSKSKIKALLEECELNIENTEQQLESLKNSVNLLDANDFHKFESLSTEISEKETILAELYEKWEIASKDLEDL